MNHAKLGQSQLDQQSNTYDSSEVESKEPFHKHPFGSDPFKSSNLQQAKSGSDHIIGDHQLPGAGQMNKTNFLDLLEVAVRSELKTSFEGTAFTEADCPWLIHWFNYYRECDAEHLEQAIHKYAPDTTGAASAMEYIPDILRRVQKGVSVWLSTGELTEIPKDIPDDYLPENGVTDEESHKVKAGLGEGESMDSSVKSKMQSLYGGEVPDIKVHKDGKAASAASKSDAKAMTVGNNMVFGAGEYQPGSVSGDLLIAHETAHAVQQKNAESESTGQQSDEALEKDAERSTKGALGSFMDGLSGFSEKIMPRMRSGISVQRCKADLDPYDEAMKDGKKAEDDKKYYEAIDYYEEAKGLTDDKDKKKAAEKAIKDIEKIIEDMDPYDKEMMDAKRAYNQKEYDKSLEHFRKATELTDDPEQQDRIRKGIRDVLSAQNDREYAPKTDYGSYSYDPVSTQALMDYLKLLETTGKPEKETNSKEKARKIINGWIEGYAYGVITEKSRDALILELNQDGITESDKILVEKFSEQYVSKASNEEGFSDELIWSVIDEAYRNAAYLTADHKECIDTVREIVLDILFSNKSSTEQKRIKDKIEEYASVIMQSGTKQGDPYNRMQDAMQGLVDTEYAYELLDQDGNMISFAKKEGKRVQNHPTCWERIKEDMPDEPGWYVYGLTVVDGYHSLMIMVEHREDGSYNIYVVDNMNRATDSSGYQIIEGTLPGVRYFSNGESLDSFIDYATSDWAYDEKRKDRARLWRIKPEKIKNENENE